VKTVITHQTNIGGKTGIGSRAALVRFAMQKGILARDA
jgi:DNA-binding CsgD family transcriptional regulator